MPDENKIQFRASPTELASLQARCRPGSGPAELSQQVRADLERYYYALDQALRSVDLSRQEALLLCDAPNGILSEPQTMQLLWAGVEDAIRLDGLATKWEVDGPALVSKLKALDYWQALAVVDAVERAWNLLPQTTDRDEVLTTVGLVREPKRGLEP